MIEEKIKFSRCHGYGITIHTCYGCGQKFEVIKGALIYKSKIKVAMKNEHYRSKSVEFCSYNCRAKWLKGIETNE